MESQYSKYNQDFQGSVLEISNKLGHEKYEKLFFSKAMFWVS